MIERARAKRAWEKTLPDVTDKSRMKERIAMMEEQEAGFGGGGGACQHLAHHIGSTL